VQPFRLSIQDCEDDQAMIECNEQKGSKGFMSRLGASTIPVRRN